MDIKQIYMDADALLQGHFKLSSGNHSEYYLQSAKVLEDPKTAKLLADIESAISAANVGATPNNDGEQIKLFFPAMTVEQRQESAKQMKGMGENAKVSIRNDRKHSNDQIKKLEKDKEVTADESKSAQDKIQKITDKFTAEIETILKAKEAEILKV